MHRLGLLVAAVALVISDKRLVPDELGEGVGYGAEGCRGHGSVLT